MIDKIRVIFRKGGAEIGFTFEGDLLADALRFINDCMETCDNDTEVSIKRIYEQEDEQ